MPSQASASSISAFLDHPLLKESRRGELHLNELDGKAATVQVVAIGDGYTPADIIDVSVRGTPANGAPVYFNIEAPVKEVPSIVELLVPYATLKHLARVQVEFSYQLKKSDGARKLDYESLFIEVIG